MGCTPNYSGLALHLVVVTLCICPLIAGLDRTISREDLISSLERIKSESPIPEDKQELGFPVEYADILGFFGGIVDCALTDHCVDAQRQVIIREVLIRNQFKTIDQTCNTYNDEKLLLEPPKRPELTFFQKPPSRTNLPDLTKYYKAGYLDWQEKVLDSGKIFCDPFKNLFCSSENKCACKSGSKWRIGATQLKNPTVDETTFKVDICIIPTGGACKSQSEKDDEIAKSPGLYYDPLQNTGNLLSPVPISLPKLSCEIHESNNMQDKCSSNPNGYFMGTFCSNDDLDKRLKRLEKYFNEVPKVLLVGDTCDSDAHTQLYKSEALDADKFNARLNALESFQKSGVGFCNIQKFLTCGKSGKCECIDPTMMVEGVNCTLPPEMRICGDNPAVKSMIMKNGFVPVAQRRLAQGIENLVGMDGCGEKFKCYMDLPNADDPNDIEMFCICRGFFTGENCNESLTLFLPFTRPSSLPSDAKDIAEKLKIFTEFNKVAVKLQEKLKLKFGEKCDFFKELKIRRLIRRIDSLNERRTVMTKAGYENLMIAISNFTQGAEQYCLRNFDPERDQDFVIEHSPYNQPIECQYSSRACQRPLPAADLSDGQIALSHRRILETYFSTLACGESCTKNIDYEDQEIREVGARAAVDRFENYLYDNTTFCVRPRGVQVICEVEKNGVTATMNHRTCVCHGASASCTRVCSNDTSLRVTATPNDGESRMVINGSVVGILLCVFMTLSI